MTIFENIDCQKCTNLFVGIIGINFTLVIAGVVFQWMTKLPYTNIQTEQQSYFRSAAGLIAIQRGIVWMLTQIWNTFAISQSQKVKLPSKNVAISGFLMFISAVTLVESLYRVSFPLAMMFKSCNVLPVILIGVLCSRVTDKRLKLGPKKIIVAILVIIGIVIFTLFDPEVNFSNQNDLKTELIGWLLLAVSLLADGFLPDFQAQIKQLYKPKPTEMMVEMNKWTYVFCLIYSIIIGQFVYTIKFFWYYPFSLYI